jgi:hypothetical protein
MPHLTLEVPHALGQAAAVQRLKERIDRAKEAYQSQLGNLTEEWTANTLTFAFRAAGLHVSGAVAVEDAAVKVKAQLPLPALMLKATIEKQLREELGTLLS